MSTDSNAELGLPSRLEALLFVAQEPTRITDLARSLEATPSQVGRGLDELEASLAERGLQLQRLGDRVQLTTRPAAAADVERFLGLELSSRLSPAALETLALIAYNQPITRPAIEAVRGVSSDTVLRSLQSKGLIQEVGRLDQAGRPILYGTTFEFLQHFGLQSLEELPPLPEVEGLRELLEERRPGADGG